MATLKVVMETAGPLTNGQLEGLGVRTRQVHPTATRPSRLPMAMAVQPPMVVA